MPTATSGLLCVRLLLIAAVNVSRLCGVSGSALYARVTALSNEAALAWVLGIILIGGNLSGAIDQSPTGNVAYDVHLVGAAFAACYYYLGWNFGRWVPRPGWLRRPTFRLRRRPALKIHDPGESRGPQDDEADRILAKVSREGLDRLTADERRILEDYSRRMRAKYRS